MERRPLGARAKKEFGQEEKGDVENKIRRAARGLLLFYRIHIFRQYTLFLLMIKDIHLHSLHDETSRRREDDEVFGELTCASC